MSLDPLFCLPLDDVDIAWLVEWLRFECERAALAALEEVLRQRPRIPWSA